MSNNTTLLNDVDCQPNCRIDLADELTRRRLERLADIAQDAAMRAEAAAINPGIQAVLQVGVDETRDATKWLAGVLKETSRDA